MDKNKNITKKRKRSEDSSDLDDSSHSAESEDIKHTSQKKNEKQKKNKPTIKSDDEDEDIIVEKDEISFCLTAKKRLTIRKFKGNVLVDLREFWTDDKGVNRPSKKGIALTPDNWEKIKKFTDKIDEAIKNMK